MKRTKLSHLLFGLAMVGALVLAAIPSAPAHALSDSAMQQSASIGAADGKSSTLSASEAVVVCRSKVIWRNGHRVSIRVCHRVHRPSTQ
jgi:hypothetical protein